MPQCSRNTQYQALDCLVSAGEIEALSSGCTARVASSSETFGQFSREFLHCKDNDNLSHAKKTKTLTYTQTGCSNTKTCELE